MHTHLAVYDALRDADIGELETHSRLCRELGMKLSPIYAIRLVLRDGDRGRWWLDAYGITESAARYIYASKWHSSLDPKNIGLFLLMKGWEPTTDPADIDPPVTPDVWTLSTNDGTYEVIVPSSSESKDFDRVVAELVRTVAVAENRTEQDVHDSLETLNRLINMLADEDAAEALVEDVRERERERASGNLSDLD